MATQSPPPKVAKTTTVANLSTTQRFPVERSSAAKPPPVTRPVVPPKPQVAIPQEAKQGISKAPTPLRASLEALRHPRPGVPVAPRVLRVPTYNNPGDPPEGIGSGGVPPGGVKVR
jgi:hypothetical protein